MLQQKGLFAFRESSYYYSLATTTSSRNSGSNPKIVRFLTVGQTALMLKISRSTLRLWKSVGLVTPKRSAGRYRLYTPDVLGFLKRIKYLHDVKRLNVPAIKEAMVTSVATKPVRRAISEEILPATAINTDRRHRQNAAGKAPIPMYTWLKVDRCGKDS